MLNRNALLLVLPFFVGACAPKPESKLGQEIYRLMLKNESVTGPTDLRRELCPLLNEQNLDVAVGELGELNARSNVVTVKIVGLPEGSTGASFSRPVEWFFRTQTVEIIINTEEDYCQALVRNRST